MGKLSYASVCGMLECAFFFFSSRRRHTRLVSDWSSDVCSSDLREINLLIKLKKIEGELERTSDSVEARTLQQKISKDQKSVV